MAERGRAFNRDALTALAGRGLATIVTLTVAGRPVAFTRYPSVAGRMYLYRLAFDPLSARASPGHPDHPGRSLHTIRRSARGAIARLS